MGATDPTPFPITKVDGHIDIGLVEVDHADRAVNIQFDFRVPIGEVIETGQEPTIEKGRCHRQLEFATSMPSELSGGRFNVHKGLADRRQIALTGHTQGHLTHPTFKQFQTKKGFQGLDLMANGRGRNKQLLGRGLKAAGPTGRFECLQSLEGR